MNAVPPNHAGTDHAGDLGGVDNSEKHTSAFPERAPARIRDLDSLGSITDRQVPGSRLAPLGLAGTAEEN